jgi:hypothetical protein
LSMTFSPSKAATLRNAAMLLQQGMCRRSSWDACHHVNQHKMLQRDIFCWFAWELADRFPSTGTPCRPIFGFGCRLLLRLAKSQQSVKTSFGKVVCELKAIELDFSSSVLKTRFYRQGIQAVSINLKSLIVRMYTRVLHSEWCILRGISDLELGSKILEHLQCSLTSAMRTQNPSPRVSNIRCSRNYPRNRERFPSPEGLFNSRDVILPRVSPFSSPVPGTFLAESLPERPLESGHIALLAEYPLETLLLNC